MSKQQWTLYLIAFDGNNGDHITFDAFNFTGDKTLKHK